jgi:hypothetical protein
MKIAGADPTGTPEDIDVLCAVVDLTEYPGVYNTVSVISGPAEVTVMKAVLDTVDVIVPHPSYFGVDLGGVEAWMMGEMSLGEGVSLIKPFPLSSSALARAG